MFASLPLFRFDNRANTNIFNIKADGYGLSKQTA